jgi:hypothetical protein
VAVGAVAGGDEVGVGQAGVAQAAALPFTGYAAPIVVGARPTEQNFTVSSFLIKTTDQILERPPQLAASFVSGSQVRLWSLMALGDRLGHGSERSLLEAQRTLFGIRTEWIGSE